MPMLKKDATRVICMQLLNSHFAPCGFFLSFYCIVCCQYMQSAFDFYYVDWSPVTNKIVLRTNTVNLILI